jgi:peptide/nickel transport system ATP-binding protein
LVLAYLLDEILRIEHLKKYFIKKSLFSSKIATIRATDDVSFSLNKGEVFVLAGESGSGKSTIAKLILKSIEADSGKIIFENHEIGNDQKSIEKIRMNCQMIHQDPYDSINPRMKILDIVSEPLEIHKIGNSDLRKKRVIEVLQEVKLEPAEEIIKKYPHMLSGGQRQRVVLARALAIKPKIILADEPVSMLDVSIRAEILELMHELQKKYEISFIYITHDLATARYFGQRIGILYLGKIVEMGQIEDVLFKPKHPYTQALIDAISEPDPENVNKEKKIRIHDPIEIDVYEGCRFRARCPYVIDKCKVEPDLETIYKDHSFACYVDID